MNEKYVTIHGHNWKYKDIDDQVEWARRQDWNMKKWKPRAALVSTGKISDYVGQKYNPDYTKLKEKGWEHDHCEICFWTIFESENPEDGTAYTTDGHSWICQECYRQFIATKT